MNPELTDITEAEIRAAMDRWFLDEGTQGWPTDDPLERSKIATDQLVRDIREAREQR